MGFLALIALLALFLWTRRELGRASARIRALEGQLGVAQQSARPAAAPARPASAAPSAGSPAVATPAAHPAPVPPLASLRAAGARLLETARGGSRWPSLERQLIENWTGILGAALLVAGVAFLGIYTALFLGPELRSAMIAGLAAALAGLYQLLRAREPWQVPAVWLRSAAAALFLFACFGAVAVDGLRWVEGTVPALALLSLGIAVNLGLALAAGSERFAALHTVLGLIPLAIVPAEPVPFMLACGVALFGVALAHRTRWDLHLGATLAAFGLFHLDWYLGMGAALDRIELRALAAAGSLAVAAAAALVHYRREYQTPVFERLPFAVHLLNWALLAAALASYSRETPLRGVALFAAAGAAWALSLRARALGVRWAHLLDTLIAQGLVVAGLVSFYPLVPNRLALLVAIFAQSALYARVVAAQHEVLFDRAAIYLLHGTALLLCVEALGALDAPAVERSQDVLLLLLAGAVGMVRHHWFVRARGEAFDSLGVWGQVGEYIRTEFVRPLSRGSGHGEVSLLGVAIGALLACAFPLASDLVWGPVIAAGAVCAAVAASRISGSSGLAIGASLALLVAHGTFWFVCLFEPLGYRESAASLGLLLVAAAFARVVARGEPWGRRLAGLGVYLAGADLALAAYVLFEPASSLLPGVAWLCLSLVALEVAQRATARDAAALLLLGYGYLLCFGAAYLLVGLQSAAYLGPLPARMWIEAFALACLAYWWRCPPAGALSGLPSWTRVQPYFLEASLLLLAVAVSVGCDAIWRPAAWGALALVLPIASGLPAADRLRFWALVFFWASGLDLMAVTSLVETPSPLWYDQPATAGLAAIALQVGFIVREHPRLELSGLGFPVELTWLDRLSQRVARHRTLWIYTPIFACVAVFLYWRFDKALLTLLWASEAFVVFALAALLRENHFRRLALVALAACLVRLVLYDLEQSGTLMRGLVFLGVGVLMLGMNSIYARFRSRFE